jgi:hypothetical protein
MVIRLQRCKTFPGEFYLSNSDNSVKTSYWVYESKTPFHLFAVCKEKDIIKGELYLSFSSAEKHALSIARVDGKNLSDRLKTSFVDETS